MRQYNEIKAKHPDALILFRVGDFYETFGEDAIKASRILGIVLTKRANGAASHIELAGFPHHSLDAYLPKLVRAGERVAICDQLEDPKLTKTIVKRGITELVTPGLTTSDQVLSRKSNNFLAAIHFGAQSQGVAFCDISTGELLVAQGTHEQIDKLIQSLQPAEILYNRAKRNLFEDLYQGSYYAYHLEDWIFQADFAEKLLLDHFKVQNLKGFGVQDMQEAVIACGAVFHYMRETQHHQLAHIGGISRIDHADHVWMDRFTVQNLELFHSNAPNGKSFIEVIDETQSPMGGRTLKRWLAMPLLQQGAIVDRHQAVEAFLQKPEKLAELRSLLEELQDLERLAVKLSTLKIQPKELVQLKLSLQLSAKVKDLVLGMNNPALSVWVDDLSPLKDEIARISAAVKDDPVNNFAKGEVIRSGYNDELDELRNLLYNGKDALLDIQQREAQNTGITNLKIAFNNVFGYYLEVRNTHKDKVPESWIRKQTLVNAERYITPELKEYEQKILGAEEKILSLEQGLYQNLLQALARAVGDIQNNARQLGKIDVLAGFARLAQRRQYRRPEISEGTALQIEEGRHPVIEQALPAGEPYIPNSLILDGTEQQLMMITGPNMSGKSALLRQTALISILAQMGSFVPAKSARLGVVDKVFVRVGASDNISQGESTFMVEMNETASILNNLSERSLVLLDEIGRGTSTFDGISIAWSIAEFLHQHPARPKTLFATHYHELNEMEARFPRIVNYNVSIKEAGDKILFMRTLQKGGSAHSFGIHVAKMAGMPQLVISRAQDILLDLEKSRAQGELDTSEVLSRQEQQLSFFQLDDPILEEIRREIVNLDINTLTPVEALMKLNEIKKKIGL